MIMMMIEIRRKVYEAMMTTLRIEMMMTMEMTCDFWSSLADPRRKEYCRWCTNRSLW